MPVFAVAGNANRSANIRFQIRRGLIPMDRVYLEEATVYTAV
jgi:hypothetical protein